MESSNLPDTMRAWVHTTPGDPKDVLSLTQVPVPPRPVAGSSDVLIKITHASVNSADAFFVTMAPSFIRAKPCIPGMEFSGVVVAVDPQSAALPLPADPPLAVGEHVFGTVPMGRITKRMSGAATASGALAEYVVVPANSVARKPADLPSDEAAGMGGVSSTTALTVLKLSALKKGDKVLIYGASSAVGTFVVQMAKEAVGETGKVVAVCGPRGQATVKNLGADEVIDRIAHAPVYQYLTERFRNDPFDVVLDTFGLPEIYTHSEPYLKPSGQYVTVGISFKKWTLYNAILSVLHSLKLLMLPTFLGGTARKWVPFYSETTPELLEQVRKAAEEGKLRTQVDSVCSMEDALTAYDRVLNRRGIGKVIVKIQNS